MRLRTFYIRLAYLPLLGALFTGCASQQAMKCYDGPPRPVTEVCVVKGHGTICLVGVDGNEWDGFGKVVEVLPGMHSFVFEPRTARGVGGSRASLRIQTQPGHLYQTSSEIAKTGNPVLGRYTVRVHLEDITTKVELDPLKRTLRRK